MLLVVAIVMGSVGILSAPPTPAEAASGSLTLVSNSGNTQYFNGSSWVSTSNTSLGAWAPAIGGTNWVYCNSTANDPCGLGTQTVGKVTSYRAAFNLPAGVSSLVLNMSLHADNSARVFVNGNQIGQLPCYGQPEASCDSAENFNNDPESVSTSNTSYFQAGTNYLQIDVWDVSGASGLDYRATVNFSYDTPPVLGVGGTATYVEDAPPVIVAPGLTLTDLENDNLSGAKVSIGTGFNPAQDSLGIQGGLPAGISSSYNAAAGVLSLSGTASPVAYQQALRQVTYSNNSQNPNTSPRTVTFNIGTQLASANGHFYEFVSSGGILWTTAKNAAAGQSLYGLQGYLATITSAAENTFIKDKLAGNGWLGASDAASEGSWKWVTGPESGTVICGGVNPCPGAAYTNWNVGEPNNAGDEDYLHMIGNVAAGPLGTWNDLPLGGGGGAYFVLGYVVEYGGTPGDPALQLSGNVTVNVQPVNDPPTASAGGPYVVNEGSSITLSGTGADHPAEGTPVTFAWDLDNDLVFETLGQNVTFNGLDGLDPPTPKTVRLQVCDNGSPGSVCTVATTTVTINNVAPDLQISGANTAYWVNWTSANLAAGSASGVITLPDASTIGVTLQSSNCSGADCALFSTTKTSGGTNYWIPSTPYTSPQVPNGPPDSDVIALKGGSATVYTVTFTQPIVDPIMAMLSLGQPTVNIDYDFNAPFTIVSQGAGFFTPPGCGTCQLQNLSGDILRGNEGHGTIKFLGTYPSFSWTVPNPEIWHGFTFGARSSLALAQTVIVNEGQTATNNGTWSDPGLNGDGVIVSASVGSVFTNANRTWNWSFPTNDGPTQSQTVTVTAKDKDGASTSKTFPLVVNNVAPTASLNAPTSVVETELIQLSLTGAFDPSTADIAAGLQYAFDCGSGFGPFTPSNIANCVAPEGPTSVTVGGKVQDKDGGFTTYSKVVSVTVPVAPAFSVDSNPPPGACICTPEIMNTNVSGIEHWWVKTDGSGTLKVDLTAHSVNNLDPETVVARIFPASGAGAPLATITASYTAGTAAGTEVTSSGSISPTPGTVYLIRITTPPPTPGTQPHYSMKIWGALDAAIKSATFASLEPHNGVRWFFNVSSTSTETVSVRIFNSGTPVPLAPPAPGGVDPLTADVTLYASGGTVLGGPSVFNAPNPPGTFNHTISGTASGPGKAFLLTTTNMHYRLERIGGTDNDVYLNWLTFGFGKIVGTVITGTGAPSTAPASVTFASITPGGPTLTEPVIGGSFSSIDLPVGRYKVTINPGPGVTVLGDQSFIVDVLCDKTATGQFKLNRPPTVDLLPAGPINEGAPPITLTAVASDPDGDPLTYAWTDVSGGGVLVPGVSTAQYSHADGPATGVVEVSVSDGFGGNASDQENIQVNNVAPTVSAGPDQSVLLGSFVTIAASFTDPGADTWTYTINWGDGSATTTGTAATSTGVSGSHEYVVPGPVTVTVCVTDDDLGQHCDSLIVTFTSNTGKITAGVLRFGNNGRGGFNVQSGNGGAVKGELQYHNGSENLHAHTMTHIVVSPDRTKGWFAGVLTDGRTFVAYVEDNGEGKKATGPDVFKLWVAGALLNGDGVLTGGNVQIHK